MFSKLSPVGWGLHLDGDGLVITLSVCLRVSCGLSLPMLPTAAFALGLSCSRSQPKFTQSNFFKKLFFFFFFSLKVKLQGMRHLAGQRHQELTELGQRRLVLHPLLAARGGPGGMRRLQVKWEAPLL